MIGSGSRMQDRMSAGDSLRELLSKLRTDVFVAVWNPGHLSNDLLGSEYVPDGRE